MGWDGWRLEALRAASEHDLQSCFKGDMKVVPEPAARILLQNKNCLWFSFKSSGSSCHT